jgi:hypothetical protein
MRAEPTVGVCGISFSPTKVAGHKFNFRAAPMPHWNGVTDCEVLAVDKAELLREVSVRPMMV